MRRDGPPISLLASLARDVPPEWLEGLLDSLPTPLLLLELGTARVLYANAAAAAMAGGEFPRAASADDFVDAYPLSDRDGSVLPAHAHPGVRAARGERLRGVEVDWHLPGGVRSLLVQSELIEAGEATPALAVVTFEDVSAITAAEADARRAERVKDETVALLDTLFFSAPVGLAFYDLELRYVRVNETLARLNGVPADRHLGRHVGEVLPALAQRLEETLRRVLDEGEPVVDVEVVGRTPATPDADATWTVSFYPVRHTSGVVLGVGCVVVDVTERAALLQSERRARTRAAFLARAGEVLGASLDSEETLVQLAALAVPAKADWCAIDMLDPAGRLQRVAVRHLDPAKEALGHELFERYPIRLDDRDGVALVLRTGQPTLYGDIPDELLRKLAQDDEHLRIARELGLRSAMVVPLRSRGEVVGAMTFVLAESGGSYGEDDLSLALEVARRASVAIENASLHRQLGYIARTLQASLLPPRLPEIPGFELAARYRAAGEGFEVGGDFYDVFPRDDDSWTVVLGDVVGKGPAAAALTALARHTVRAAAYDHPEPSRVLALLNDAIRREAPDERFMSAVAGTLVPGETATITVSSAGHPPAILLHEGRASAIDAAGGLLGVAADAGLTDVRVELARGDAVVLYTDGVADAAAPARPLTQAHLERIVEGAAGASADEIAAALEAAALDGTDGRPRDDMAIVVLRRLPG